MGEERVETAEAVRAAVVRYVSYNPAALDGAELRPIRSGEAFREDDGTVRIGAWRLEERESGPVLVRGQGVGTERRTVIRLAETDGEWRVTGLDEERVESR
jgi:hypothetical protein